MAPGWFPVGEAVSTGQIEFTNIIWGKHTTVTTSVTVTVLGLQAPPPFPLSFPLPFPSWLSDEPSDPGELVGAATTVTVEVEVDWRVVVASLATGVGR